MDFQPAQHIVEIAASPHALVLGSAKGKITISLETGKVTIKGLAPDAASMEFWRGVERTYPAFLSGRGCKKD